MHKRQFTTLAAAIAALALIAGCERDSRQTLSLGIPTTVHDSGLLDALLPEFENAFPEYRLRFVAAGSGELLALGTRGDLDVLLTHSPAAELAFVEAGLGLERRRVMANDFLIVGPPSDPAAVHGMGDAAAALSRIAEAGTSFLSRGDDSGTHRKELELRATAELTSSGPGYREMGAGMGAALRAASELEAYTLTDRATYLNLEETLDLEILVEGDPRLLNVYSVIIVSGARERDGARAFADWLISGSGRDVIGAYGVGRFGAPLFSPAGAERSGGG